MRFKLILTEHPRTSQPLIMLARHDGKYSRPIVGTYMDIRLEDMPGMLQAATAHRFTNYILPLPPIAHQVGKHAVMNFGHLEKIVGQGPELNQLIASNKYLMLPADDTSEYWQLSKAPWWEYAAVMDEHDGYIKAPLVPRPGEPTADEIDERLDEFDENHGKLEVLSPLTLGKQLAGAIHESYLRKLHRI